jgi:nitrate/nitrite transporter NarK
VAHGSPRNLSDLIYRDMLSAKGAAAIDSLLILGIIAAIIFADRFGRIRLQILGFLGCAVGLTIAAASIHFHGSTKMVMIFGGFMIFNFMTNMGPNAMTYLLSGEVFPTKIRGVGAGFATSFAKIGAVLTAFLFPLLLKDMGTQFLLLLLVGTSLLGAWITWSFRIETNGISIENIGRDLTS